MNSSRLVGLTLMIVGVVVAVGAIGLLPVVDFQVLRLSTAAVWLDLALMGILSTYLAYFIYYTGLRTVEASRAVLATPIPGTRLPAPRTADTASE